MASTRSLDALIEAIDNTPLIDNHAHPLLKPEHLPQYSLLAVTSEAHGDATQDARQSLSHIRAIRQLADVLGCKAEWAAVVEAVERRRADDRLAWTARCLTGIETILVDDGLDNIDRVEGYTWHDAFTRSKCKRIVRIEALAQEIIAKGCGAYGGGGGTPSAEFLASFEWEIRRCIDDPEVAGFKSIICYRGGLDIPRSSPTWKAVAQGIEEIYRRHRRGEAEFKRLEYPLLNHLLVHTVARLITGHSASHKKPIQFHTGLGDNDITLTRSSPSHLQEFIREYPAVPVVLLHAGYPWTKETAYLATTYANVYADIGEVFPCISHRGQKSVVKEMLELCPWSKVLCSTDGHWFPETYLLANRQIREALKTVLTKLVQSGELDGAQAVQLAQDVLFNNSKRLYNLEVETTLPSSAELVSRPRPSAVPSSGASTNDEVLRELRSLNPKWLRIYWHDYTSTPRCRLIPIRQVYKALKGGGEVNLSVTKAALGILQIDVMIPQIGPSGGYLLRPDWGSLRRGPAEGHVSCHGEFRETDGPEAALCSRTLLRRTVERARAWYELDFLVGFEIEFLVVERNPDSACPVAEKYRPLRGSDGHAWSTARAVADWGAQGSVGVFIDEAAELLDAGGVEVEMFHPESAPGQFELVLAARPALEACDALLHARQVLESTAARHGLRVTLHPKPFAMSSGSASHAHLSVRHTTSGADGPEFYKPFYAGILRHLRALVAFTYANPASYERVADGCWAGGRWVAWGTLNKEVPLRKCDGAHWEFKALDGLANPYLAIAAVLCAGVRGYATDESLVWEDCVPDPARLTDAERRELGISEKLPENLRDSLAVLAADEELREALGSELVQRYIDVKNAELEFLEPMEPEKRRQWIIERY